MRVELRTRRYPGERAYDYVGEGYRVRVYRRRDRRLLGYVSREGGRARPWRATGIDARVIGRWSTRAAASQALEDSE